MSQLRRSRISGFPLVFFVTSIFAFITLTFAQSPSNQDPSSQDPSSQDKTDPQTQVSTENSAAVHESWLKEALELMTGSFSSKAQNTEDRDFFDIRLQMIRIWKHDESASWLYVEQAVAEALGKPYRQRIYRISANPDGTIRSEVYVFPEAAKYAGAWKQLELFDALTVKDLTHRDGCDVIMTRKSEKVFEGGTIGKTCASERGGSTYATAQVLMDQNGLVTWDRGFNAADEQVWGATKSGYRFLRVTTEESTSPPVPPSPPTPSTPTTPPTQATPASPPLAPIQPSPLSDPALIHPAPK